MKVSITLLLIACPATLIPQSPPSATPAVMRWLQGLDARKEGLDRMRRKLKALANGPNGNTPGAVPRAIACPVALESALVTALTEGHLTKGGQEEFHLIVRGQREQEYLDVSYSYSRGGALRLTGILKLPTGWSVGFQPGEANFSKFLVVTDDSTGCIFEFDSADPFASKAVAQQ
jgi:hypothetical protein